MCYVVLYVTDSVILLQCNVFYCKIEYFIDFIKCVSCNFQYLAIFLRHCSIQYFAVIIILEVVMLVSYQVHLDYVHCCVTVMNVLC